MHDKVYYTEVPGLDILSLQGAYPRLFWGKDNNLYETEIYYLFNAQGQGTIIRHITSVTRNPIVRDIVLQNILEKFNTEELLQQIPRRDFAFIEDTSGIYIDHIQGSDIELIKACLDAIKKGEFEFITDHDDPFIV